MMMLMKVWRDTDLYDLNPSHMGESWIKPLHEVVAEKLIEALKKGTAPWQLPWDERIITPYNPTTDKRYKGGNALHLMLSPYKDPR